MDQGFRRGFTAAEKTELWDRWQRGESPKATCAGHRGKPACDPELGHRRSHYFRDFAAWLSVKGRCGRAAFIFRLRSVSWAQLTDFYFANCFIKADRTHNDGK